MKRQVGWARQAGRERQAGRARRFFMIWVTEVVVRTLSYPDHGTRLVTGAGCGLAPVYGIGIRPPPLLWL